MKLIERPLNSAVKERLMPLLPDWLADIMARRIDCPNKAQALLTAKLAHLPNPNQLPDMTKAVDLLYQIIAANQSIICVVDYDTDGINSGAILQEGLTALGARVQVMVTNRHEDGYGFSAGACQRIMQLTPLPDCIITADLGSSDGAQFEQLQHQYTALGKVIRIIVTDHHHISSSTPPKSVDAFINPNREDTEHDYKHPICGAMVAWNLIAALRSEMRLKSEKPHLQAGAQQLDVKNLLDFAAIATIGDMVDLSSPVNRIIVQVGLARMNQRMRPAWQLLKEALDSNAKVTEETIGFQISPRINALSRMGDDGHTALTWLTTSHISSCQQAWAIMCQNNDERKDEQALCETLALVQAEQQVEQQRFILIAYVSEASHGVVGLAAGRLAQAFARPAIVFSQSDKGQLTGSARSIAGYDIRALLEKAQQATDKIIKFGGHSAAAGLTILPENLELITNTLEDFIRSDFNQQIPQACLYHDGLLPSSLASLTGLAQLDQLAPFGQGLPVPVFKTEGLIVHHANMGKLGQHKRLTLNTTEGLLEAVWFNANKNIEILDKQSYQFILQLTVNHFRGQAKLQALIQFIEPSD